MIEIYIKFNEEKAEQNGKKIEELEEMVISHMKKYSSVHQINKYMWKDDSDRAMGIFGVLINKIADDDAIFLSLDSMQWNVDGRKEDCIKAEWKWREWKHNHPIQ